MAVLVSVSMLRERVEKEINILKDEIMAPTTLEVSEKVDILSSKFEKFKDEVFQRLTRVETIMYMAFGGNSIATIVLFILNLIK